MGRLRVRGREQLVGGVLCGDSQQVVRPRTIVGSVWISEVWSRFVSCLWKNFSMVYGTLEYIHDDVVVLHRMCAAGHRMQTHLVCPQLKDYGVSEPQRPPPSF